MDERVESLRRDHATPDIGLSEHECDLLFDHIDQRDKQIEILTAACEKAYKLLHEGLWAKAYGAGTSSADLARTALERALQQTKSQP